MSTRVRPTVRIGKFVCAVTVTTASIIETARRTAYFLQVRKRYVKTFDDIRARIRWQHEAHPVVDIMFDVAEDRLERLLVLRCFSQPHAFCLLWHVSAGMVSWYGSPFT